MVEVPETVKGTLTGILLGALRTAFKVTVPTDSETDILLDAHETLGIGSLSVIEIVWALPPLMVYEPMLEFWSVTTMVSGFSRRLSSMMGIEMVPEEDPGVMVRIVEEFIFKDAE